MPKKGSINSNEATTDSHANTTNEVSGPSLATTKKNLAFLSGNVCANPDCHIRLFSPEALSNIGEAAHIAGEKLGAARYDPTMTDIERNHINNLVYLCANCHTTVDADKAGKQYSAILLHEWKLNHEVKVALLLDKGFESLDFPELEEAANWLLSQPTTLASPNAIAGEFNLIALNTKIIKHCLSASSQHIIIQACSRLNSVEEFINERAKEDTTSPSFPERLKAGVLCQYYSRVKSNLKNDELFSSMCEYMTGGFDDYATKSASVSVLVYFFEKCDIFSS